MNIKQKLASLLTVLLLLAVTFTGCQASYLPPSANIPNDIITLENIPPFSNKAYVVINDNKPYFEENEINSNSFEFYSELDNLGRCGTAYACVGVDLMPTEDRGNIGSVKPSGWHSVRYDIVDGKFLYNRCHLIAYMLAGENANEKNLITGTRYLNIEGMLPFEDMVHDYVKETKNHVLYRVTPIFKDNNLLASGCLMEGYSVEDNGDGIMFCVYAYNAQPGITIDYLTGESSLDTETLPNKTPSAEKHTYVINKSSKKFHIESCSQVDRIVSENKELFEGTPQELIKNGYIPCGSCCKDIPYDPDDAVSPTPSPTPTVTPSPTTPGDSDLTYVLNTGSKKYHKESCSQVSKIKEENKAYYTGDPSKLINEGYSACKSCFK